MNAKLRLAAALALLVLLLGGLATWDEWKTKQEKDGEKTKNKLAEFKPEDVIELDYFSQALASDQANAEKQDDNLKQDHAFQVSAVKKDGVWRMTKPMDVLADQATIEGLINTLRDYAYVKVVSTQRESWGEYGLLEPRRHISLRIGGNDPRSLTVYLGNKAPIGYDAYLRTSAGDQVLLGGQHILTATSKNLGDFRDRSLLKIVEAKLRGITFQRRGSPAIEIVKADGKYALLQPEKLDADPAAVREFVESLNQLKAAGFVDSPDAATKDLFAQPDVVVSWQEETGEKAVLKLVEKDGKLMAAFDANQRVYVLPDDYKAKLKRELFDFRSHRILEPEVLEARTVDIDGQIYQNLEGTWYTAVDAAGFDDKGKFKGAEKDKPKEKAHIRAFMVDLEFAKTDRFLALDDPIVKSLPAAPLHHIVLSYADKTKQSIAVDLFRNDADATKYLVRRSGSPFVFRVATSAFNSMVPGKETALPDNEGGPEAASELLDEGQNDLPEGIDGTDHAGLTKSKGATQTN